MVYTNVCLEWRSNSHSPAQRLILRRLRQRVINRIESQTTIICLELLYPIPCVNNINKITNIINVLQKISTIKSQSLAKTVYP